jgi:hypothetical protein
MSNNVPYELDNDGCRIYFIDSLGEKKIRITERNGVKESSAPSSDIRTNNPIISTNNPVISTNNPVISTNNPVISTSNPLITMTNNVFSSVMSSISAKPTSIPSDDDSTLSICAVSQGIHIYMYT